MTFLVLSLWVYSSIPTNLGLRCHYSELTPKLEASTILELTPRFEPWDFWFAGPDCFLHPQERLDMHKLLRMARCRPDLERRGGFSLSRCTHGAAVQQVIKIHGDGVVHVFRCNRI
jgi:hypothetical protein